MMIRIPAPLLYLAAAALLTGSANAVELDGLDERHPGAAEFVATVSEEHDLDPVWVAGLLADAERKDSIIRAMKRPAEKAKPWHEYRKIFMTADRVAGGKRFMAEHAALLAQLEDEFGVPPEMVTAIIGVETKYGAITGSFRVIDALATLSFHYPPRAKFFRGELESLLLLANEERLAIDEVKGSYAGAMGIGQFIPSSYRAYAVDFDGDGQRDLWGSPDDAIASVANYFAEHRWARGQPVTVRASVSDGARALSDLPIKPQYPADQLAEWGYTPAAPTMTDSLTTVIELEGVAGPEYWIGYDNFYVITRYNRSRLYAMAVYQLSEALAGRTDVDTHAP
ncbi:MAG: lytic murein transglycosylase B [Pseudomonadota bacterium]